MGARRRTARELITALTFNYKWIVRVMCPRAHGTNFGTERTHTKRILYYTIVYYTNEPHTIRQRKRLSFSFRRTRKDSRSRKKTTKSVMDASHNIANHGLLDCELYDVLKSCFVQRKPL